MTSLKSFHYISYKIGPWPWIGESMAKGFLNLFNNADLKLEKFGTSETRTFPLEHSVDNFISTWNEKRYIILKSPSPWRLLVSVMMYPAGISHIAVYITESYITDPRNINTFTELVRSMYSWGDFDYSFVAHEDEYDSKNMYMHGNQKIIGGGRLDVCLPGIYWINVFGSKYVEWLGEKKFNELPAFANEQFANGGRMIVTRPALMPFNDKASMEIEREIKNHLGKRIFFDKNHPNGDTVAPPFAKERSLPIDL